MTDDGRPYPNNSINTKQHRKGWSQFIPVVFAMQFKFIAYWVIIFDCVLQIVTNYKYIESNGVVQFYAVLLVIVFIFIYLREIGSEKKRALMDQKQNSIPCTKIVIDETTNSGVQWKEIKLTTE